MGLIELQINDVADDGVLLGFDEVSKRIGVATVDHWCLRDIRFNGGGIAFGQPVPDFESRTTVGEGVRIISSDVGELIRLDKQLQIIGGFLVAFDSYDRILFELECHDAACWFLRSDSEKIIEVARRAGFY